MHKVLSVNVGKAIPNPHKDTGHTGINKRPAGGPVEVRAPGPKHGGLGSGLVGDFIGDTANHGGDEQAVYAYAREDLDFWAARLGRELDNGGFGENLTTAGFDVTNALIGERWQIGDEVVLQVTVPRIPCSTFQGWLAEQRWTRTFTQEARPGAYLRVVQPGAIRTGDPIRVVHKPDHGVTLGLTFRALTLEAEHLPDLLSAADDLPDDVIDRVHRRLPFQLD
ncbi:MOSC domain-containing protein [Flindersiella endophytica]